MIQKHLTTCRFDDMTDVLFYAKLSYFSASCPVVLTNFLEDAYGHVLKFDANYSVVTVTLCVYFIRLDKHVLSFRHTYSNLNFD